MYKIDNWACNSLLICYPFWRPHLARGRQAAMTPDERERMAILCERIAKEQDPCRFVEFVRQLNQLLELKWHRLDEAPKTKPN